MAKTGTGRSGRRPLTDISNRRNHSKPSKKFSESKKKISEDEDSSLDRLLLVHSDLSNLIHQIDELVSQAFQLKQKSEMGRQQIESFTHVLSDMHSSLKVWVPRFQQAFSRPFAEAHNHQGSSFPTSTVSAENDERKDDSNTMDELELSSLISPSPLVSWRAECRVESGKQLFLMTPLTRSKVLSSRYPGPSRPLSEKVANADASCRDLSLPLSLIIPDHSQNNMLVGVKSPKSFPKFSGTETENTSEFALVSSPQFSNPKNIDHSMYLITPMSKMSPPKTCVLLEPASESFEQNNSDIPKWKPLTARNQNCDEGPTSENCSRQGSGIWASKYAELFGFLPLNHKSVIRREAVEASPCFSPPKTCVLMEPPSDKLPTNLATSNLRISECPDLVCTKEKDVSNGHQSTNDSLNSEPLDASLAAPQSTPIWMGSVSTIRTGKRPGENTLKRELWTKFEAVSTNPLRLDLSVFQGTKAKGFLDRLEDVSHED